MVRVRKRCGGVRAREWGLDAARWSMVGCVACGVYCNAASEHKCKMGRACVLSTTVDFAAGALCIAWGDGGKLNGYNIV